MNTQKSAELFERAGHAIPGGVNSPVRAFKSVGGIPLFIKSAKGAYLFDEDGNQFIDYINSKHYYLTMHNHTHKSLQEIHEDVPAEHYDQGIKKNLFQRYWHSRRFSEVTSVIKPVKGAVLDLGCHSGTFTSKILGKIGSEKIYGMDISPSAIKLAKKKN